MGQRYETDRVLNEYLLFHYGTDEEQLPFSFGPQNALHFPVRCVAECLDPAVLPPDARAIDLGCAVGRSSFELARTCTSVVGVDNSHIFIKAAKKIQSAGKIRYCIIEEGLEKSMTTAVRPKEIDARRVQFRCCDVMEILQEPETYDIVLAANLLCRLPHPKLFLKQLPQLLKKKGQLLLISPYSWLEEFTKSSEWLNNYSEKSSLAAIKRAFGRKMRLFRRFDMPFLIREHQRKYEWCVSEATIWKKM